MPEVGRGVAARAVANVDGTLEYSWNITSVTNTVTGKFDYNLDTAVVNGATSYIVTQGSGTHGGAFANAYFTYANHYDASSGYVRVHHYARSSLSESDLKTSGVVVFQSGANVGYMHNGPVSTMRAGDLAANHASVNSYATAFVTVEPLNSDTITNSYGVTSVTSPSAGQVNVNIDTSKYSGVVTETFNLTRPDVKDAPFAGWDTANSTAGAFVTTSSAQRNGYVLTTWTYDNGVDNDVRFAIVDGSLNTRTDPTYFTAIIY